MSPAVHYQEMPVDKLIPAEYNPREITDDEFDGLGNSITRFGLVQPIVWNKRSGNIVGGHQRLKVLLDTEQKKTVVAIVDLPPNEEKVLNVALNNPHIEGRFTDHLQGLLEELREEDAELFRDVHLDRLLAEENPDITDDDNKAPGLPENTTTKAGDIWHLGHHRLICGSSAEADTVRKVIGDDACQLMWTDPPYGISYEGRVAPSKSRSNKVATKDTTEDVAQLLAKVFAVADEYVLPPMSTYYIAFTPAADNFFYLLQVTRELGWRNKQIMSLVKDRLIISRLDYHPHHEIVLYGFKPGEGRHGRMGKHCWYGDSKQKDVFFMKKPSKSKLHPTMKPIELMALHISNSSRMGDFVYEPFGGSGSTMIACEKLDRKCLCVELEPAYCDVIVERWQDQTGEKAQRS